MKKIKFETNRLCLIVAVFFAATSMSTSVYADLFYKTGSINRVVSDNRYFGGCLINISDNLGNGCPDNGWVSFDCDGAYSSADEGKRLYASALVAFSLNKRVSIRVDNSLKHNGTCVADRLDIIK